MQMWGVFPVHYEYDDQVYSVTEGHSLPTKVFKTREKAEEEMIRRFREWFDNYPFGETVEVDYQSDDFFDFFKNLAPVLEVHHEIKVPSKKNADKYNNMRAWSDFMRKIAGILTDDQMRDLIGFLSGHGYEVHQVEIED